MTSVNSGGIGHPALQHHPRLPPPALGQLGGKAAAIEVQTQLGELLQQRRPEHRQQMIHRLPIGWMVVTTQKGEALPPRQGLRCLGPLHHPGAAGRERPAKALGMDHRLLHIRVTER